MTIQELEDMIQECRSTCNTQVDTLNGLYTDIAVAQAAVDKLKDKLKRLQSAQATLQGIED